MNSLRKITSCNKLSVKLLIYVFFIVLHIFLFNINAAEWGDSYKILKAAEYIKRLDYPKNEKRPPLFSIILATRPQPVDAVVWGRVVMLAFSLTSFFCFDKLVSQYIKKDKYQNISLILFTLNPVYLYWSIRIMSDIPFSFFVILTFYLLSRWKGALSVSRSILLGFILGLAILTRFEGYILLFSVMVGMIFMESGLKLSFFLPRVFFRELWYKLKYLVPLGLTTLIVILPYWLFRSPIDSKYLDEQEYRSFDFSLLWIYFVSLLYILGFIPFFYFVIKDIFSHKSSGSVIIFLRENVGISVFLLLECILILWWPAAVPRLFVAVVPFFIIVFVRSYEDFETQDTKLSLLDILALSFLLLFYGVSQYYMRLQFLLPVKTVFVAVFLMQLVVIVSIIKKKSNIMLIFGLLSIFIWSLATIWLHRYLYLSIRDAAKYAAYNLSGKVIYNDVSSISDWYITQSGINKNIKGDFHAVLNLDDINYKILRKKNPDYLILTNEYNPYINFGIERRPYLTLVKEFKYNINGKVFFSDILKFNKELGQ